MTTERRPDGRLGTAVLVSLSHRAASALVFLASVLVPPASAQQPSGRPALPVPPRPGFILVDDMWLPQDAFVADGVFQAVPWPNGTVYIAFENTITSSQRARLRTAWAEIEATSGVEFVEVAVSFPGNHVLVQGSLANAALAGESDIGMIGGAQVFRVASGSWDDKYVHLHELFHTLGFRHEQQRLDRDIYVTINWNNISPTDCGGSCAFAFQKLAGSFPTGAYDFESIMHYRDDAFSDNGQPTIVCTPAYAAFQDVIGNRSFLSTGDADALQFVYGQPDPPQVTSVTPSTIEATIVDHLQIEVRGGNFLQGSTVGQGVTGTRVRFDGTEVYTTFIDENTVSASVPASLLQWSGNFTIDVIQHAEAGGVSSTSVNFSILPAPCLSQTDRVGHAVAGVGDVNGDGKGDFVVGIPGRFGDSGEVRCYSGSGGAVLWQAFGGNGNGSFYGKAVAAIGDITGDGKAEVLVGAPGWNGDRGQFEIRSGAGGATLAEVFGTAANAEFGAAVARAGDVDGDGDLDFLIGIPGANNDAGRVELWSSNGGLLRAHDGGAPGHRFGAAVAGGLDLNLDGVPDYVIGAPDRTNGSNTNAGRVYAYSGASGALLTSKDGDGAYDRFGFSVALVPNTGSSGPLANIVAGAPEIGNVFSGSGYGPGYVRVFNHAILFGTSYATLATWAGAAVRDHFGWSVAGAGDVDDDGHEDVLAGIPQTSFLSPPNGPGSFEIRSGRTGVVLYRHQADASDEALGFSVASAGDTDGDARLDVVVGSPGSDVGCIDAGGFYLLHPPVPPESRKVMITEVSTGSPDCVEITNFGTAPVSLVGWTILWKDGATLASSSIGGTLAPGEICVVKESGGTLPEVPAGVQVRTVLPNIGTATGDVAVALVNFNGAVVDEVHLEGGSGSYAEGSLGGRFRGVVGHVLTNPGEVNAERIFGLDSNAGRDWTTGGPRSMGLENRSAGSRGSDPVALRAVRINETDDSPDCIELFRPVAYPAGPAFDLQGWYLLCSGSQGSAHARFSPFSRPMLLAAGGYVVLGESTSPPPETPSGVPYLDVDGPLALGSGIPWTDQEYDCALYDSYGRLVDLLRTTGHDDRVVHNDPRAPSHWSDFTGAAGRGATGDGAVGRNPLATDYDTNTGSDFRGLSVRTMGSANNPAPTGSWTPSLDPQLDVRLNDTALGGGITVILNAGPSHAGEKWTYMFSVGHHQGTGPFLGLPYEAFDNWLITSTTPPFFGFLDARGSARMDFPSGTLPAGADTDDVFFLQVPNGDPYAPITLFTNVLEYDT